MEVHWRYGCSSIRLLWSHCVVYTIERELRNANSKNTAQDEDCTRSSLRICKIVLDAICAIAQFVKHLEKLIYANENLCN